MEMRLNLSQQQTVLQKKELVNYALSYLGITESHREYEDIVSTGTEALVVATTTFNPKVDNCFEAYAFDCILRAISAYCSEIRKHESYAYFSEVFLVNDEERMTAEELIADCDTSIEGEVFKTEMKERVIDITLNCLTPKERFIALCKFGSVSTESIARFLSSSESHVYKIFSETVMKIRRTILFDIAYHRVFTFKEVENTYWISFKCGDMDKLKESFRNVKARAKRKDSKIKMELSCTKNRATIKLLGSLKSLSILAYILNGIDEFKAASSTPNSNKKKTTKKAPKEEMSDSEKQTRAMVTKHISQVSGFTVKQVKKQFPEYSASIIESTIKEARKKAWIRRTGRGTYVVDNYL